MILRFLLLVSTLVLCSIPVLGDAVITSGTVSIARSPFSSSLVTAMSFSGAGFSVSATGRLSLGDPSGYIPCGQGCEPNSLLRLSAEAGTWTFGDLTGGMTINGANYTFVTGGLPFPNLPGVWGYGSFGFSGGSVLIPVTDDPVVTLTSTFTTFLNDSFLTGTYNGGSVGLGRLFGAGTVTLTLRRQQPGYFVPYVAERVTYSFVQPTPEPATLLLLGSGVIGIIGVKLRRR